MKSLTFDRLFAQALKDWPEEVDLSIMEHFYSPTQYVVRGLWEIQDAINDKYEGLNEEVIMTELTCSIFEILRRAAKEFKTTRVSFLRKEAVKEVFEERLRNAMKRGEDLNWREPDYKIVEEYFKNESEKESENKSSGSQ